MIYDVKHVTTYSHETPVSSTRCAMRLLPRSDAGQTVIRSALELTPKPETSAESTDFFGNRVVEARIATPHAKLRIVMTARVEVRRSEPPAPELTPTWEQVARTAAGSDSLAPDSPAHFIFAGRQTPMSDSVTAYARKSFAPDRPVLESAADLMRRIHKDFTYDPDATDASTPLAEAFEAKSGVCQDFAHIMIAGLRGLGLPAAYVSGYIRTIPHEGQPRLEGADASHAWAAIWCGPEFGWLHLDPTNAIFVGNDHIVVAFGRDYADVSPVDGVIRGGGRHTLTVGVSTRRLPGADPAPGQEQQLLQ